MDGSKTVLIENEFGEIGIDGGFLKESGIEIKEMNSGCICCSLVGDFGTSLKEVISTYAPERILIEPSGVGKLSDVLKAVENVAGDLDVEINSAVAVVDASKCKMYSGAGAAAVGAAVNIVIFNGRTMAVIEGAQVTANANGAGVDFMNGGYIPV